MEPQIIRLKKANSCPAKYQKSNAKKRTLFHTFKRRGTDHGLMCSMMAYLHGSLKRNARGRTRCARCCRN